MPTSKKRKGHKQKAKLKKTELQHAENRQSRQITEYVDLQNVKNEEFKRQEKAYYIEKHKEMLTTPDDNFNSSKLTSDPFAPQA